MNSGSQQAVRRVLLVDDEEPILFPMKAYFEAVGWDVECAQKIEEAEALLGKARYDVAVVDLRLTVAHGTEGLELVSMIRECSPETRVVLLTAYGSPEVEEEVRRRGVAAYRQKPMPLPELAELMTGLLAERP